MSCEVRSVDDRLIITAEKTGDPCIEKVCHEISNIKRDRGLNHINVVELNGLKAEHEAALRLKIKEWIRGVEFISNPNQFVQQKKFNFPSPARPKYLRLVRE